MDGKYEPNKKYIAKATWNKNSPAVQMMAIPGMKIVFSVSFKTDENGRPYDFKDDSFGGVGGDPHPDDLDFISFTLDGELSAPKPAAQTKKWWQFWKQIFGKGQKLSTDGKVATSDLENSTPNPDILIHKADAFPTNEQFSQLAPLFQEILRDKIDLNKAAASGNTGLVKEALLSNPDLNIADGLSGFTALHHAVSGTDSEERAHIVELLHLAGADLEKKDTEKGLTPLHYTALRNKPLCMKALLKCGANVNAMEGNDATALHGAAFWGHLEVAKILLDAGANPDQPDCHGKTPIMLALAEGHNRLYELMLGALKIAPNATPSSAKPNETTAPHNPTERISSTTGLPFVSIPDLPGVLFCRWLVRTADFRKFVDDHENNNGYDYQMGEQPYVLKKTGWVQQNWDYDWMNPAFVQNDNHPVCCVSWIDAQKFCEWLTKVDRSAGAIRQNDFYRLPTDGEWSIAVGLGNEPGSSPAEKHKKIKGFYPWGAEWPPPNGAANVAGEDVRDANWPEQFAVILGYKNGYVRTSPVGSFKPNSYGLHDMSGNVWEWCNDISYDGDCNKRIMRGGAWSVCDYMHLLSSFRGGNTPSDRCHDSGFRIVLVTD